MKNAILLHGMPGKEEYYSKTIPSASNSHWFPWLQNQLLIQNIPTQTPEMFKPYAPNYALWKKEFERQDITSKTILVGHSCGGGFLLRWLSENPSVSVDTVILVAPWIDLTNYLPSDNDFFDFTLDPQLIGRARKFLVFHSTNDGEEMQKTLAFLKEKIPEISVRLFENHGHFCKKDLGSDAFPELLEEVLK